MKARYDIGNCITGWYVVDTETGQPATVNDCPQIGLSFKDADDLADLLSGLEADRLSNTAH